MKQIFQKAIGIFAVMGLPLLLSCTEDLESGGSVKETADNLAFSITADDGYNNQGSANAVTTRGAQANTTSLSSGFGVSCAAYPTLGTYTSYGHGSYFYKIQAMPNIPTAYYWPTSDYKVSFFAYYPYDNAAFTVQSAASATGSPTYAYTVPSDIASQIDIMTAERTDVSCATHPTVELSFAHRLSDIRFSCENVGAESITLKSISVCGVKYSGTLTGSTWTLNNNVNSLSVNPFTLSVEKTLSPDESVDATGTTNHFIMLPQTVPSGTQIFDIYATVAGETGHFYYTLTSNLDLQAGKVYNFSIKLSDLLEVVTSIQDWTEETDRTGIPTYQNTITTTFGIGSWESEE